MMLLPFHAGLPGLTILGYWLNAAFLTLLLSSSRKKKSWSVVYVCRYPHSSKLNEEHSSKGNEEHSSKLNEDL